MKLTISKKLVSGFLAVSLLLAMVSGIAYYFMKQIDRSYSDLLNRRSAVMINLQKMQTDVPLQNAAIRGYLLAKEKPNLDNLRSANQEIKDLVQKTESMLTTTEQRDLLKKLGEMNQQFLTQSEKAASLMETNPNEAITVVNKDLAALGRDMRNLLASMIDRQQELMVQGSKSNNELVQSVMTTVLTLSIAAFAFAIVIGLLISRMISKPLARIAETAEQIAAGDLSVDDVRVKNRDEIGDLAKSFNQMKENLRALIRQVASSAEQVAASSEELTASSGQTSQATQQIALTIQEVAAGSERQVHSVEETVNAINDMSTGVQQIAGNAQMVSVSASKASELSVEGAEGIQSAIRQMNSINETVTHLAGVVRGLGDRSGEIGQIVEVITNIAEQTNLLALNAAIEAARAGEHGKGFAVVADEVRKLAEQSANSAQQIAALIAGIQEETKKAVFAIDQGTREVTDGIRVVHSAGASFEQIQNSVAEVADQIQEVSAASQQMSAGTQQIVQSVKQIADIAETTAAGTQNVSAAAEEQLASMEEISASAASLSEMAEELHALVGQFKV